MSLLGPVFKREPGGRQPYIPLGPFHVRFPFIHYRFETADYIQGLIMCAVCLGIIPVLTEYLGMPFDIAITIVILNGFLYCWHAHRGTLSYGVDYPGHPPAARLAENVSGRRSSDACADSFRV